MSETLGESGFPKAGYWESKSGLKESGKEGVPFLGCGSFSTMLLLSAESPMCVYLNFSLFLHVRLYFSLEAFLIRLSKY